MSPIKWCWNNLTAKFPVYSLILVHKTLSIKIRTPKYYIKLNQKIFQMQIFYILKFCVNKYRQAAKLLMSKFLTHAFGSVILEAQDIDMEEYEILSRIWEYKVLTMVLAKAFVHDRFLNHLVCKNHRLFWQTCWQQSFRIQKTTLWLEIASNWHCKWRLALN